MRGEREVRERGGRTPVEEALERAAGRDNDGGLSSDDEGNDDDDDAEEKLEGDSDGAGGSIAAGRAEMGQQFYFFASPLSGHMPSALPFTAVRTAAVPNRSPSTDDKPTAIRCRRLCSPPLSFAAQTLP